jgi:hypothetical protein
MNVALAALVIAGVAAIAVAAMLLVRWRAPEGSYFADGDRAAGVFGVLATGFSVLLGFIVFLAFESYDQSRRGAEAEALVLAQQVETAQFLPRRAQLTGELVCYARSVVHQEWPRAEAGEHVGAINPWGASLFRTLETVEPRTPSQQSAYDKWLDQTSGPGDSSERSHARSRRCHPDAALDRPHLHRRGDLRLLLFFADRGEGAITQAVLMGSLVSVIAAMLLLIRFLDSPVHEGIGGVRPVAMERTLGIIAEELRIVNQPIASPSDAQGAAAS